MKQGLIKRTIPSSNERIIKTEINRLMRFNSLFQNKLMQPLNLLNESLPEYLRKERDLRESEEIFHATFNQAAIGIAHIDLKGRFIRVNQKYCRIVGWNQRELLSKTIFDITVPEDIKRDKSYFSALRRNKVHYHTIEKRYTRKDGTVTFVRVTRSLVRGLGGKSRFIVTIVEDINEEKKLHKALEMLSEAGKILTNSLDFKETLNSISSLVIPVLADWCVVDILNENGAFDRVKVAYPHPKYKKDAAVFYKYPPGTDKKTLIERVKASKKALIIKDFSEIDVKKYATDTAHMEAVQKVGIKSTMIVPMVSHNTVIGVLTFISTNEHRQYSAVDLVMAEQLVIRVTAAIENARLFQKANDSITLRDEFLSIASHELKNPLTSIKGFVQILIKRLDIVLDDASKSMLIQIEDQIDRSSRLISDLLDFTSIRTDRLVLQYQSIDLNKVVTNTIALSQQLTDKHKIVLKGNCTVPVHGDKHRLTQVISNLLTNAIKYSPDSEDIVVEVKQTLDEAIIKVQDFGIGISKKMQVHIFEQYFRSDAIRKQGISGLGLGLYIASEIVKKHNGRIWVKSEPNKGSAFYIALPLSTKE
jgi:PAS domain S-box-containing protein